MRTSKILLGLTAVAVLSACGEAHREAAIAYHQATEGALIRAGQCADSKDCSIKQMAFWAGGNNAFPWANKAYVTVYNVSDLKTVSSIKEAIIQSRASSNGPPCQLTVFSGAHNNAGIKVHDETL